MWCDRNACRPRTRQNVLFSSAPQARTGRGNGHGTASGWGTWPRERRRIRSRPPTTRVTESSVRMWISRSCSRKASAMGPRRSSASSSRYAMGSSDTFPLVSTNGPPKARARRWWSGVYGSITPRYRFPGATASATGAGRRRHSTMGRRGPARTRASSSPMWQSSRASSTVPAITAKGLSSRCLRDRRARAASSDAASTARWYPPSPFTATTIPRRRSAAVASTGSPGTGSPERSTSRSEGPQAGQHTGWAWNRRSEGSRYSRAQSPHMANGALVVAGRSYGTSRTIVNRGPQFVQFTKGYRYRRSSGSNSSRRQSSHVAVSGETSVTRGPPASLGTMANPTSPVTAARSAVTRSTTARGGASLSRRARNRSTGSRPPSTSTKHPGGVVPHQPGQAEPGGQPVHERPEPDALDDPLHPDPQANQTGVQVHRLRGHRAEDIRALVPVGAVVSDADAGPEEPTEPGRRTRR